MRNVIRNIWLWVQSELGFDLINVVLGHISESSEGKIYIAYSNLRRLLTGVITCVEEVAS